MTTQTARRLQAAGQTVRELTFQRDRAVKERDELIVRYRKDGATLQACADLVGLTRQAVKFICDRNGIAPTEE